MRLLFLLLLLPLAILAQPADVQFAMRNAASPSMIVLCRAHACAGQLTIPRSFLSVSGDGEAVVRVSVSAHPAARQQFSIMRSNPSMRQRVLTESGSSLTVPVKVE